MGLGIYGLRDRREQQVKYLSGMFRYQKLEKVSWETLPEIDLI